MTSNPATVACKRCGALNGADFKRCIRCNGVLDEAEPAEKAARRVPAPRVRGKAPATVGPGTEPLLGRWEAEQLPAGKLMLALNMVVFALHFLLVFRQDPSFMTVLMGGGGLLDDLRFGALPLLRGDELVNNVPIAELMSAAGLNPFILGAEPWRLISACFVHGGILHIGFNMYWMVQLARMIEPAIGSIRFLIAYVMTGVFGFVATLGWFMIMGETTITRGASGSVFGLIGLVLGFLWRREDPRWKDWLVRAVVYTLLITFFIGGAGPVRIDHSAHIGGLVSGAAFGALFAPGAPRPSSGVQRVMAYVCVLACVASLIAVQLSPYLAFFAQIFPEAG